MELIIKKRLLKIYLKTSIPAAFDLVAQTITWSIEAILLGHLSAHALAGVGISLQVIILTFTVVLTFIVGSSIITLRHLGRKDYFQANHILAQALLVGVILSVFIGLFWYFGATQIFRLLGEESNLARQYGTQYLKIMALGAPLIIPNFIAIGIIRSSGDTFHSLLLNVGVNIINLTLAPFLIFGWWIFPRLEVEGAAYAILISHSIIIFFTIYLLRSRKISLFLSFKEFISPNWKTFKKIMKLGFPTTVEQLVWAAGQLVLSIYVAKLGVIYLAVHQIFIRIQSVITMLYHGLGSGAMTMIGKFLGANQIKLFKKTAILSSLMGGGIALIISIFLLIFKKYLILAFTSNAEVVELGINMMFILALVQVPRGVNIVLSYGLRGGADIKWLMWITIVSVFIFEINLAFLLVFTFKLFLIGIWAVQGIDELCRLSVNYLRFYKKDWEKKSVKIID